MCEDRVSAFHLNTLKNIESISIPYWIWFNKNMNGCLSWLKRRFCLKIANLEQNHVPCTFAEKNGLG